MSAIHFEGQLPQGVTYLAPDPDNAPGNPTSDAMYGFQFDSFPPVYAIARLTCNYDDTGPQVVSNERVVEVTGPLEQGEYERSMRLGGVCLDSVGDAYDTLAQDDVRQIVTGTVPRASTTEQVIGRLLGVVFASKPL